MKEHLNPLRPYFRGLPIIILAMVIAVMAAKKYLNYTTPVYESTVKLKLADASMGVPNNNLFKDFDVFASSEKISAEIELLKSTVLLDKALNRVDFDLAIYRIGSLKKQEMYGEAPFTIRKADLPEASYDKEFFLKIENNQTYELSLANKEVIYKGDLGSVAATPYGKFLVSLNDSLISSKKGSKINDNYSFIFLSRSKLLTNVRKDLDVISVDKDVPVIRISFKSTNPMKAAKFANTLAETYIQDYIETKYQSANVTSQFLDTQITGIRNKLNTIEGDIQSYRDDNKITNIHQETETDLRKIAQLKIQQTNVQMNLKAMADLERYVTEGKDNFLELAPNFEAFTDLLSTEIIKKIKALQAEKIDLQATYTNEDERVIAIDKKIEQLTSYLLESIKNTKHNVEVKYKNLSDDITKAEASFIGVPEKEKLLTSMNREFNIYQQSYNFLNEKKIDSEIAEAAKIAFHRIISPAEVPTTPVSPNRTIITIVSAILGMFAAILFILIVHKIKAKVNDVESIESNSEIPISVLTPKLKNPIQEADHFLRQAIQLAIKGLIEQHSVVCFSSYRSIEGSNYNAWGFVMAFDSQHKKVLLVDVDNKLNLASSDNFTVITPNINLVALTDEKYRFFSPEATQDLINTWKAQHDLVIILNEDLKKNLKSSMLMNASDLNLICFDSRLTPLSRIMEANLMKEQFQFKQMHFLLNRYGYTPNLFLDVIKSVKKLLPTRKRIQ